MRPIRHSWRLLLGVLLAFVLWVQLSVVAVRGAETNLLKTAPGPAQSHFPATSQEVAAEYERAGRKREAAAVYEQVAQTNAAARKVLSHRLVTIYAETGETNKALAWAREVMRENPDPPAYLAAVHARLGQWPEARAILEREIAQNTNATRGVTLRWQLAEVWEKAGDKVKARKLLDEAAAAARGTPTESAARKRLDALTEPAK